MSLDGNIERIIMIRKPSHVPCNLHRVSRVVTETASYVRGLIIGIIPQYARGICVKRIYGHNASTNGDLVAVSRVLYYGTRSAYARMWRPSSSCSISKWFLIFRRKNIFTRYREFAIIYSVFSRYLHTFRSYKN